MLRFDQLKFTTRPVNEWNGKSITPIRIGHTLPNVDKQSPSKRQRVDSSDMSLFVRDGTRLSVFRTPSSPYMRHDFAYRVPKPPIVVVSYSVALSNAVTPFRATIAGTVHDLEEIEPTNTGDLKRNFKLADDAGKWVHCIAHGKHTENESLKEKGYIVVYFGWGRGGLGSSPPALWLFKDTFVVPVPAEQRNASQLSEQVSWQ